MANYSNAKHSFKTKVESKGIRKKRRKKLKKHEIFLLIIFVGILLISSYNIILWLKQNIDQKELTENLIKEVIYSNDSNIENESKIEIDFEKLKIINNETIAWMRISEINLNTPIVQTNNNDYYLDYNFNKQKNKCGCLFMDYSNNKDFTSKNTIIYGHNLYTGMMFGDLKQIFNGEHGNNIKIHIYTENKNYEYKIFSTYQEEPNLNIVSQDINEKYIANLKKKSKIDFGDIPENINNIITLVTCDGTGIGRIVIHGYPIEDVPKGE